MKTRVAINGFGRIGRNAFKIAFARNDIEIIACLLYTSDAADERSSVDLGGRRIIKKKQQSN